MEVWADPTSQIVQDCDSLEHEDFHKPPQLGFPKLSVTSEGGNSGVAL